MLAGGSDALATEYVLLAVFAYGAANLVGAPLTASLADLLGRRPRAAVGAVPDDGGLVEFFLLP